ncbi:MAG: CoA transferase [Betaproteobacteria bacterium]|nr:CoA transferase [Betaproteobacteria bacterium]
MNQPEKDASPLLRGLRVLDIAHQYSGANAASLLGDLGAEVLCIEHPQGSPIRTMLPKKEGESMWWKVVQRGKKNITLNLSSPKGREIFLSLARNHDVLIENFRPGTLERWGIGPDDLERSGANLTLLRISGFGQTGPMRNQPGFGVIAEAMSGFAHLNGYPDGPPTFPSTTLGDGVASVFGAFGVMAAMFNMLRAGSKGVQVVDVALFEAMFRIIPTQVAAYDQLGKVPKRPGNFLGAHGSLRNVYRSKDNKYFCVGAVGYQAVRRILVGASAEELVRRIDTGIMDNKDMAVIFAFLTECDLYLAHWALERPYSELAKAMADSGAVHGPVFDVSDIVKNEHFNAREDLIRVPDNDFGSVLMQGVVPKFSDREHKVAHTGRPRGADNSAVYGELMGFSEDTINQLKVEGVL